MTNRSERLRSGAAGMLWHAVPAATVAMLLVSCIAVPVPIPIPVVTGLRVGPKPVPPGAKGSGAGLSRPSTTVRYDNARMSAEQAEAHVRQACADGGSTLDTLTHEAARPAAPDEALITYTCRT